MAEQLTLKTNETPTIFNKEMAIGFLGVPLAVSLLTPLAPLVGLGIAAAGLLAGGLIGKARMKKEKAEGIRVTDKSSFFNKDMLLGGLIGHFLGTIAAIFTGAGILGLLKASGAAGSMLEIAAANPVVIAVATTAVLAAGVGLGIYKGGKHGQKRMEKEFQAAQVQQVLKEKGMELTPELMQGVEMVVEKGQDKSFVEALEQERQKPANLTLVR